MTLRAEYSDQVISRSPFGLALPLSGVNAVPFHVNDDGSEGAIASAYTQRSPSIGSTLASTSSNSSGKIDYYLDVGNYNIHYHDPSGRISDYVRQFTAVTSESLSNIATILSNIDSLLTSQIFMQSVSNTGGVSSGTGFQIIGSPGDLISNVIVTNPTDLIAVWYTAAWQCTGGDEAAIFIDGNQLRVPSPQSPNGSQIQSAVIPVGLGLQTCYVTSAVHGLMNNATSFIPGISAADASSGTGAGDNPGQVIGFSVGTAASSTAHKIGTTEGKASQGQAHGGPCYIEATPGVHTISVRYKPVFSSHTISPGIRHMRVGVIPFHLS